MQAHKKQSHAKSKNEAKTYGKLNIEFNVARASNNSTGIGSGRGRGKKSSVLVDDEDSQYQNVDRRQQQHRRSPEVDESIATMSKAQFLKDEEERNRQKRNESLREQYERWQQENQVPVVNSENKQAQATKVEDEEDLAVGQQSMWRSVVGQGNAPKINKEAEFPSLASVFSKKPQGHSPISARENLVSKAWGGIDTTNKNQKTQPLSSNAAQETISKKQSKKAKQKQQAQSNSKTPDVDQVLNISSRLNLQETSVASEPQSNASDHQDIKKYLEKPSPPSLTNPTSPTNRQPSLFLSDKDFPPPGFAELIDNKPPGFNSLPQSLPSTHHSSSSISSYVKPEDYDKRNQQLSNKLADLFGIYNKEEFMSFKEFSLQFQQSRVSGKEYLAKCTQVLDFQTDLSDFYELIQEMIVLLPDAEKQHDLYKAFAKIVETSGKAKAGRLGKSKLIANRLMECEFCEQYFLNSEINTHQMTYHKKDSKPAIDAPINTYKPNTANSGVIQPVKKPQSLQKNSVIEEFPSLESTIEVKPPSNQS